MIYQSYLIDISQARWHFYSFVNGETKTHGFIKVDVRVLPYNNYS